MVHYQPLRQVLSSTDIVSLLVRNCYGYGGSEGLVDVWIYRRQTHTKKTPTNRSKYGGRQRLKGRG